MASGRISRSSAFAAGLLLPALLLTGCFPAIRKPEVVDPATAPKHMWSRLAGLESYRFRLHHRTSSPIELGAEFVGTWEHPDLESWNGHWERGGTVTPTSLVGAGPAQYRLEGRKWIRSPRGIETKVADQARQLFVEGEPAFREERGRRLVYDFNPFLRMLDPAGEQQFSGRLEIHRDFGFPVRIECKNQDGSAQWLLVLDRFNRAGRVRVPFVPLLSVVFGRGPGMGRSSVGPGIDVLKERMTELGWEYRFVNRWGRRRVELGRDVPRSVLDLLLSAGEVAVWTAERPGPDDVLADERAVTVAGDAAFRVLLAERVAGNGALRARLELENLPESRLVVEADETGRQWGWADSTSLLVLTVNGEALSAAPPAGRGRVVFTDFGAREYGRVLAALANHRSIPGGFVIREVRQFRALD